MKAEVARPEKGYVAFFADLDESAEKATAGSLDGVASYGVVVRGERPSTRELLAHLDERYDGVM